MKFKIWSSCFVLTGLVLAFACGCEDENGLDQDDKVEINDSTENTYDEIPAGWSQVGDLYVNNIIWSITADNSGNVYAAGSFTNASGYYYVAKWNGTKWTDMGLNANSAIYALTTDASGNVYATGGFTNGATSDGGNQYVAKWDGSAWSDIGGRSGTFLTSDAVGNIYSGRSKWNGSVWSDICPECSLTLSTSCVIATNASGDVQYAAGVYQNGYRYVAQYDGGSCWSELGSLNANADISSIVADNSGNVYAAGYFTNGNMSSSGNKYVAKWDGTAWIELGGLNPFDNINYLAIDRNKGYLYASAVLATSEGVSTHTVEKWDGTSWIGLGNLHVSPDAIYVDDSGKLYSVFCKMETETRFCVVVHE